MPPEQESGAMPSLLAAGALHFETDRLPWQRSLRWIEPPRNRRRWVLGLLFALLITALELAGFALGMRSYRTQPRVPNANQVVQVILLEPEPVTRPPPEPEPPAFVRRPSKIVIAPPKVSSTPPPPHPAEPSDAMSGRLGNADTAVPVPKLFNADGSIRLGTGAVTLPQAPKTQQEAGKARWAEIEKRGNPVDCHKTRFAQAYAPDEDVGDNVARKYLKWVGLADMEAVEHRNRQRAEAGGCDPAR
jgi:hypothetical protein